MASEDMDEASTVQSVRNGTPPSNRRSTRSRKTPAKYDEDYQAPQTPSRTMETPSRPKRKAASVAQESIIPEDPGPLLEEVLAAMSKDERKEYGGWVELESEPAFFNVMLHELGAEGFKVQEVFGMDEETMSMLPQPVHGLVFLYQYEDAEEPSEPLEECPPDLWFANQTTANACATVALINIIMNAAGAQKLGAELQAFKDATQELAPPYRGHQLDTDDFIRSVHNSLARRIDLVAEDLLLDNRLEEANKKKRRPSKKQARAAARRRPPSLPETAYHYIAYVPLRDQVWEMNGFDTQPRALGPHNTDDPRAWLQVAAQAIQTRMLANELLSFNLLSVCQSPLLDLTHQIILKRAHAMALDARFGSDPAWPKDLADNAESVPDLAASQDYMPPKEDVERWNGPQTTIETAVAERRSLADGLARLSAEYVAEVAARDETIAMVQGRQRDYTPAIHTWVRLLAEKGVLRELMEEVERDC